MTRQICHEFKLNENIRHKINEKKALDSPTIAEIKVPLKFIAYEDLRRKSCPLH